MHTELYGMVEISCSPQLSPLLRNRHYLKARSKALMKTVASYGGGVNSTAMLLGLAERSETVDLILFADTGGEKPETYAYVRRFAHYLSKISMPAIQEVAAPN